MIWPLKGLYLKLEPEDLQSALTLALRLLDIREHT